MRRFVARALIVTGLFFAVCWFAASPAPADGFHPRLSIALNVVDYRFFIKKCLAEEWPYRPVTIAAHDACYPPIAYCLVKCFPPTSRGEAVYVAALVVGLLAGLVFFLMQRQRQDLLLCIGAVALTVPFASGPIKGNPSAWAAGALFVFLAWYDAEAMWKRCVAAVALAFAASLKITPVLYGLLYLRGRLFDPEKWPKEEIFVAAFSFAVLFAVPFVFFGGPNEVNAWLRNAIENSRHYSQGADFGLVPVIGLLARRIPLLTLGFAVQMTTAVAVVFGVSSCFARQFHHALTLLGVAMAFLCHHDYGLVYLLPAFASWVGAPRQEGKSRWIGNVVLLVESALWFLVFESVLCVHSYRAIEIGNMVCNWAVVALGVISLATVVAGALRGCAQGTPGQMEESEFGK